MSDVVDRAVALLSNTSPGPWQFDEDGRIYAADGGLVGFVQEHGNIRVWLRTGERFSHADGALIAAAPTIVAELASEVLRLREDMATARRDLAPTSC